MENRILGKKRCYSSPERAEVYDEDHEGVWHWLFQL